MFFLGISAHLMIYLLVPAFLIVFFYFKGLSGTLEVSDSLPVTAIYEFSPASGITANSYIYEIQKAEAKPKQPHIRLTEGATSVPWSLYRPFLHPVLYFTSLTLRAPPTPVK